LGWKKKKNNKKKKRKEITRGARALPRFHSSPLYSHVPEVRVRVLQWVQNIPIRPLKQTWTIVMQIKPITTKIKQREEPYET
jgi:hypothetical protein